MIEKSDQLVKRLLNKSALKDKSVEDLQALTDQYPYFSAAQLLLAKRLEFSSEAHAQQKAKAALFVYNPLQIDELLNDSEVNFEEEEVPAVEENLLAENNHLEVPVALEPVETITPQNSVEATEVTTSRAEEPEIKMPALNIPQPSANNKLDITFEPYHTVDYFASQGIKLSQSEVPTDQFGKQLKSFTEWLKTMKKLPTTAITHNTDGVGEKKVEKLAAHSLQNADIVTESMAEVWIKQGNLEKASEVYNKLSLQNPSKKAYFAAKIESLKKPN
jgi:hypothetical protein